MCVAVLGCAMLCVVVVCCVSSLFVSGCVGVIHGDVRYCVMCVFVTCVALPSCVDGC